LKQDGVREAGLFSLYSCLDNFQDYSGNHNNIGSY
jgi:hypothetical protein